MTPNLEIEKRRQVTGVNCCLLGSKPDTSLLFFFSLLPPLLLFARAQLANTFVSPVSQMPKNIPPKPTSSSVSSSAVTKKRHPKKETKNEPHRLMLIRDIGVAPSGTYFTSRALAIPESMLTKKEKQALDAVGSAADEDTVNVFVAEEMDSDEETVFDLLERAEETTNLWKGMTFEKEIPITRVHCLNVRV